MKTLQKGLDLPLLPADETLFRKHIQRELNEIREGSRGNVCGG